MNFIKKNKNILLIIFIIILIISLNITEINNIIFKNNDENKTIILKNNNDFYRWFKDLNKLYNSKRKIGYPNIPLKNKFFEEIDNFSNNEDSKIKYNNNKYYYNDNETLELDVNTRSLRYIIYNKNNIDVLCEIKLKNGFYYILIINNNETHKIKFNKNSIIKTTTNTNNKILVDGKDNIFLKEDFEWK